MENLFHDQIRPRDWLEGPFWSTPVQVVSIESKNDYDVLLVVNPMQGASLPFSLLQMIGNRFDVFPNQIAVICHSAEIRKIFAWEFRRFG